MGIQYLNSYIKRNVSENSMKKCSLCELYGKVIVIDTSIYLYRFLVDKALLDNMYMMISLFRYYKIVPIFIFDGKAPIEKNNLLAKRNNDKITAENRYNYIKDKLNNITDNNIHYDELYNEMIMLKKKFVRLKRDDIKKVQKLMNAFGVSYIEAEGEADILCARLVQKKYAYACLSEDMDLFVYGCPRVLRYLSLINETVVLYSLDNILKDLKLTHEEFKEICILSGTDYNYNIDNQTNLYKTLNYFKLFKKSNTKNDFYTWLDETSDYIPNIYDLYNIYHMFKCNSINLRDYKLNNTIKPINKAMIEEIMKPEGFIFIK
tara:strand:- start:2803 stop:3762 length:960 start_codon:yes stop_codon:yes gene_type:complete